MPVMMPLVVFVLKQCLFSRPLSRDFIAAAEIFLLLFINEQNHEKVVRCCDDSFLVGQIKKKLFRTYHLPTLRNRFLQLNAFVSNSFLSIN